MGCVTTISDRLSAVAGVTAVQVDLASATARIESTAEVPLQTLQKALEQKAKKARAMTKRTSISRQLTPL